jgi:hypothetical protein
MFDVHAIERHAKKARHTLGMSLIVIGALSALCRAILIAIGFALWELVKRRTVRASGRGVEDAEPCHSFLSGTAF